MAANFHDAASDLRLSHINNLIQPNNFPVPAGDGIERDQAGETANTAKLVQPPHRGRWDGPYP